MEESKDRGKVACHTNVDLYYLKLYIILLKGKYEYPVPFEYILPIILRSLIFNFVSQVFIIS